MTSIKEKSLEDNISNIIAPFLFKESKDTEAVMNIKYSSVIYQICVDIKIIKQTNNTYRIESKLMKTIIDTIDKINEIYDFHIKYLNNEIKSMYNEDDDNYDDNYDYHHCEYEISLHTNNIFIKPEYISEGNALKKFIKNSWELIDKLSKK
jgi:hypothetical protein